MKSYTFLLCFAYRVSEEVVRRKVSVDTVSRTFKYFLSCTTRGTYFRHESHFTVYNPAARNLQEDTISPPWSGHHSLQLKRGSNDKTVLTLVLDYKLAFLGILATVLQRHCSRAAWIIWFNSILIQTLTNISFTKVSEENRINIDIYKLNVEDDQ